MDSVNIARCKPKPADIRFARTISVTAKLAAIPIVNSYTIELEPGHGFITTDYIALLMQPDGPELWFGRILNVVVNTLTIDTPINFPFEPDYTTVIESTVAMNVNGSVTPIIFGVTNLFTIPVTAVRFVFHMTDATAMDDSMFGGLSALTRGVVARKRLANGNYTNYWNIKSNSRFAEIAYELIYSDKAPAGVYGLTCRMTYGGDAKHGTAICLRHMEAIQLIVQDDLTGLLSFGVTVQGYFNLE